MVMGARALLLVVLALVWIVCPASAEEWSRARISRLPDSAFALVETAPDGQRFRHLPHHDETGTLDLPHLQAARARLGQVQWVNPANEEIARRHLDEHWGEMRNR